MGFASGWEEECDGSDTAGSFAITQYDHSWSHVPLERERSWRVEGQHFLPSSQAVGQDVVEFHSPVVWLVLPSHQGSREVSAELASECVADELKLAG